jgi:metallo-beta-lactamase family protein
MRISIHGAAGGEVTGSAYLVRSPSASVLVDFGLFQGAREVENLNRRVPKEVLDRLDAVVLTHAHLDHAGRLPLLAKLGYSGPIFATPATIELARLILEDAAHLQQADVDRDNRKRRRQGKPPIEPIYTDRDVDRLSSLYRRLSYDEPTQVAPGVVVRAVEAGHILGSASFQMIVEGNGQRRVVVFSGDLGPRGAPLHRDPVPFRAADLVFMESTYGDRDHRSLGATVAEVSDTIREAVAAKGKILVPVFAVGRTQLLLYLLAGAFRRRIVPRFPVYVDSPMANEATSIYRRHVELFDDEALEMMRSGEFQKTLDRVHACPTADASRALNQVDGPCLIMAGSGMCTGGRILHHLRHNLAQTNTTVLIVGYQSHGSLGRKLIDGAKAVSIFGERIPVRATVRTIGGLSGHAGQSDLLTWLDSLSHARPRLVLTHGEDRAREPLARLIKNRFRLQPLLPKLGDEIAL